MAYDIGYRRPPAAGQFKKGASGNPKGRPKGSRNFVTLLEQELQQTVTVNENGKKKKITRQQAIVKRIVANALNGDAKAILLFIDIFRRTGKFEQVEVEGLLPENYESILEAYVASQAKHGSPKSESTASKGEPA